MPRTRANCALWLNVHTPRNAVMMYTSEYEGLAPAGPPTRRDAPLVRSHVRPIDGMGCKSASVASSTSVVEGTFRSLDVVSVGW